MKKVLFIYLFACVTLMSFAQSSVRINNYWENPYYINPAAINDEFGVILSLAARKQWFGISGAPTTFFASGTTYIDKMQTQFGLKAFSDNIGLTRISNLSLSYAYSVTLNPQWRLHLGLAATIQNQSYDESKIIREKNEDKLFDKFLPTINNYNCDIGAQLKNKSLTLGFASQNLLSVFFGENNLQTNSNFLYALYRKRTNMPMDMQYGVSAIQYGPALQMEFSLSSYFKAYNGPDLFQVGLFYRTRSEMGVLFGVNLGESLHVGYSYDYNVSGIMRNVIGTHEIMLIYKFDKKPNCISCPQ